MKIRISEHIHNIEIGFKHHSVSLHFRDFHNQDPSGVKFWGVDCVHPNWRGSNLVGEISKRETRWIVLMDTLTPRAMNIELNVNCYIRDF